MGIFLATLLIVGMLLGCRSLIRLIAHGATPAVQPLSPTGHDAIVERAMADLDRKYEELLRS